MIRIQHADDPKICPDLSQRVTRIEILLTTSRTSPEGEDETSKQLDGDHYASKQRTIILDEHKNLRSDLYYKLINGTAVPGGMLHHGNTNTIVLD